MNTVFKNNRAWDQPLNLCLLEDFAMFTCEIISSNNFWAHNGQHQARIEGEALLACSKNKLMTNGHAQKCFSVACNFLIVRFWGDGKFNKRLTPQEVVLVQFSGGLFMFFSY